MKSIIKEFFKEFDNYFKSGNKIKENLSGVRMFFFGGVMGVFTHNFVTIFTEYHDSIIHGTPQLKFLFIFSFIPLYIIAFYFTWRICEYLLFKILEYMFHFAKKYEETKGDSE